MGAPWSLVKDGQGEEDVLGGRAWRFG